MFPFYLSSLEVLIYSVIGSLILFLVILTFLEKKKSKLIEDEHILKFTGVYFLVCAILCIALFCKTTDYTSTIHKQFLECRDTFEYELVENYTISENDLIINISNKTYRLTGGLYESYSENYDLIEEKDISLLNLSDTSKDTVVLEVYKSITPEEWKDLDYDDTIKIIVYR